MPSISPARSEVARVVEAELGDQGHHVDRPVLPGEDLGAGNDQHQRRADRVPAVAEDVEGAGDVGVPEA